MRTSRARGFGSRKHGHRIKWKSEMWREMAGAESPSSAEACAASHLRRLGRKAGAASCRPHCEQLLAETTGSGQPLENKSMVYFHPVLLFLQHGCYYGLCPTQQCSPWLCGLWHFPVGDAMVSDMPFSEVKEISLVDLLVETSVPDCCIC